MICLLVLFWRSGTQERKLRRMKRKCKEEKQRWNWRRLVAEFITLLLILQVMAGGCQIAKEELELGHELGRCVTRVLCHLFTLVVLLVLCTRVGVAARVWPLRSWCWKAMTCLRRCWLTLQMRLILWRKRCASFLFSFFGVFRFVSLSFRLSVVLSWLICSKIHHPHIILCLGACFELENLMIVTELMSADIESLMEDSSRTFTLAQRLAMAKDAALGTSSV